MRIRLVALAALALVAGLFFGLQRSVEPVLASPLEWLREAEFYNVQNLERINVDPRTFLVRVGDDAAHTNPDRIRILAVGDSYVWGVGITEPVMVWPRRLEELLEEKWGEGTVEVLLLGQGGLSTMGEAERLSPELLQGLQLDAYVQGFVRNDLDPTGLEKGFVCNPDDPNNVPGLGGQPCAPSIEWAINKERFCNDEKTLGMLRGLLGSERVGLADKLTMRRCQELYDAAVVVLKEKTGLPDRRDLLRPESNPYWSWYTESVDRIATLTRGLPAAVGRTEADIASYEPTDGSEDPTGVPMKVFEDAGITVLPMTNTRAAVRALEAENNVLDRCVNGADCNHFGTVTARAAAEDFAAWLEQVIDPARLARAQRGATPVTAPLYYTGLPVGMEVSTNTTRGFEVSYDQATAAASVPASTFNADGETTLQFVPCKGLERPHARVSLARSVRAGVTLRVTLAKGGDSKELVLYGLDARFRQVYRSLGVLRPGQSLTVKLDSTSTSALLVAEPGTRGCPINEDLRVGNFGLSVSVDPRR